MRDRRVWVQFDEQGEVLDYELLPRAEEPFLSRDDVFELRGLVGLAFDARGEPGPHGALRRRVEEIAEWWDRRHARRLEARRRSFDRVLRTLRHEPPTTNGG
jgi:hypothetical protein